MSARGRARWVARVSLAAAMAFAVAGCGGGSGGGGAAPAATARVVPTMPPARFAMPTTQITVAPSTAVTATEEAATPEPQAAPAVDLTRGETLYANRGCAECHGAAGEGVADKGSALAGTEMTEQEFTNLMRTGGEIGPDHLYGPTAISPSGMTALHAWLQSLPPAQ